MPAILKVDAATERLRSVALAVLGAVFVLPLIWSPPPAVNIVITAALTVFTASLRTVGRTHEAEILSQKDAMRYPVLGSISLLLIFVAIKFLPKHIITYIIMTYFCALGVLAIGELLYSTFSSRFPEALKKQRFGGKLSIPFIMPEPEDLSFSAAQCLCGLVGLVFSLAYAKYRHFLLNNGMGLAYSIEGIAMINLGSTTNGLILLWGLFLYDIFWVFCTPVMVAVATNIDGPIKLLFRSGTVKKFNMLGLGDIVIPGLFTALMLHFDARNGSGKHYFYSAMVGYSGGLASTILVMNYFKAAQPALLYIVPAVCLAVFAQAAVRGEIKALLAFSDEGSDPIPSPKKTPAEGQSSAVDADEVPAELRTFDAGQTAPGFQVVGELKKSK